MLYDVLQFFFRRFWRAFPLTVEGVEHVPLDGPLILAANHLSNWDPPFLATYLDRPVSYMAKQELFDIPVFGSIIPHLFAFPVKRGAADRTAIKTALAALKKNFCIGVFPEGTRSRDGKLQKGGSGVSLLASLSGAPVVPTAIVGTNAIFGKNKFPPLAVLYGEPLRYPGGSGKEALAAFSQEIMARIEKLMTDFHSRSQN